MPSYANRFSGPATPLYRVGRAGLYALVPGFVALVVALWVQAPPHASVWLSSGAIASTIAMVAVALGLAGYLTANAEAVKTWDKLPDYWKPDPVEMDERSISFDRSDPLNPSAPNQHLTVPYSLIDNVTDTYGGYWVSGWKHASWMSEAWTSYLAHHPEVARKDPSVQGHYVTQHVEEVIGRRPEAVPLLDRGGVFVLTPENGERLKRLREMWKERSAPLSEATGRTPASSAS